MKFKRQNDASVDVNLTPLIDVVFLLLIFFMVSTSFTKESRLTLTLPEASSARAQTQEAENIEIIVNAEGHYVINQQQLVNNEIDTLKAAMSKLSGGNNGIPVVITADANCPHQFVVRAMDAAGQLGFIKLNITTIYPQASK